MENNSGEDNSMFEKILNDIYSIICNDRNLEEFCIVHRNENKNKSPVLYEQHNLALESWCVKYVYRYLYIELFKVRKLLKKNRLTHENMANVNKLLIGALLIHPEVLTFWNMRRELVEYSDMNLDKELLLTKLILTYKNKSNEAFTYRKWILNRIMKSRSHVNNSPFFMLQPELEITQMIADRSQNNYHVWNHRIWSIQNALAKYTYQKSTSFMNLVLSQLDFSMNWIKRHISEHTGFHYRQYLCKTILNNTVKSNTYSTHYHSYIQSYVGDYDGDNITYLNDLLGSRNVNMNNLEESLKCFNLVYFLMVLLADLLYFIEKINNTYPDHESVWYHRRFVVFNLLKYAYEYHNITWKHNFNMKKLSVLDLGDSNIINSSLNSLPQENGEKTSKMPKYEQDKVESSYLYKLIIDSENKFIKENVADKCSSVQREFARRHEKWLKVVLHLNKI